MEYTKTSKTRTTLSTKVIDYWTKRNTDGWISRVEVYTENTEEELNRFIRTIHPNKEYTIQRVPKLVKDKWTIVKNTYYIFYPNRIITGPCMI